MNKIEKHISKQDQKQCPRREDAQLSGQTTYIFCASRIVVMIII